MNMRITEFANALRNPINGRMLDESACEKAVLKQLDRSAMTFSQLRVALGIEGVDWTAYRAMIDAVGRLEKDKLVAAVDSRRTTYRLTENGVRMVPRSAGRSGGGPDWNAHHSAL